MEVADPSGVTDAQVGAVGGAQTAGLTPDLTKDTTDGGSKSNRAASVLLCPLTVTITRSPLP